MWVDVVGWLVDWFGCGVGFGGLEGVEFVDG